MYQHFNPLALTDAWWQHLLMLAVAAILGYIIGYRSSQSEIEALEAEFNGIDSDLDDCLKSKKNLSADVSAHVSAMNSFVNPAIAAPIVAAAPVMAAFAAPTKTDDLKVVEGIGPKIEQLLHEAGILSFAQLADTDPDHIKTILDAAGPRFQMHVPTTWPGQSALARDGKWDELKTLQDELNKGRNDLD
jgi:predicted flap endonuclease-1-like 5' DNA nuclease